MGLSHGTKPVQERSACYISATFLSKNNAVVTPVSARYRIDDITRGTKEVLDWSSITPDTTVELVVTSEQNRILNDRNKRELRQVTVEGTQTDGNLVMDAFEYEVINRAGTT